MIIIGIFEDAENLKTFLSKFENLVIDIMDNQNDTKKIDNFLAKNTDILIVRIFEIESFIKVFTNFPQKIILYNVEEPLIDIVFEDCILIINSNTKIINCTGKIITCGLDTKASVTISSVLGDNFSYCIQRRLTNVYKEPIEPQEFQIESQTFQTLKNPELTLMYNTTAIICDII